MNLEAELEQLSLETKNSQKLLLALGDEIRQHIILMMMESGDCLGMRVGDIAKKTHLSRATVSHHLQILKRAGVVKVRQEATKNYYYFDGDIDLFDQLITMLNHAKDIMQQLPKRDAEV